jgi:hypothetical protein
MFGKRQDVIIGAGNAYYLVRQEFLKALSRNDTAKNGFPGVSLRAVLEAPILWSRQQGANPRQCQTDEVHPQ